MMPVLIELDNPEHWQGDDWEGISGGPIQPYAEDTETYSAPDYPIASARMYFRSVKDDSFGYGFRSDGAEGYGTFTIVNADTWEFDVPKQPIALTVGKWHWDIEFTDTEGFVWTPYHGYLTIKRDASRDDN